jgi:hypothetical protein
MTKGPPMLHYKNVRKSMLENSNYELYDRYITIERTVHNSRPYTVILDKTIKEAHSTEVAIPNSHSLHSTVTEKLRKYIDLKGEFIRTWQLKTAYIN